MKRLFAVFLGLIVFMTMSSAVFAQEDAGQKGDLYILFTSDVHCGAADGFGYVGLQQIRDTLEAQGHTTLLVDDGDAIQGDAIGTLSKGEDIIDIMNSLHYDAVIPGDHEFDYGMDQFLSLTQKAEFPYVSCNFNKEGELVFPPYVILEAAGYRIAFVGITTPTTLTESTPKYFQDENGNYIYGFMEDETGDALYEAVQKAVDDARAEGVDYVYAMAHLGLSEADAPWTYADVISHTNGIDVFFDGHSHDTEQLVMQNKDGEDVPRSACGTKFDAIGYSHITADKGIEDTNIWSWPNQESAPDLLGIQNEETPEIEAVFKDVEEDLKEVVASTDVELTINDPTEVEESGDPVRVVRRAETNLGDLCADAFRTVLDTDIGVINAGGVRASIPKGDITYGDIIAVFPFNNQTCVIEATGQQILDALEWGVRAEPDEDGAFLQVSGMSYEVDLSVPSGCQENAIGECTGIEGERRVKNVMVGEDPLDPEKTYTVGGIEYSLLNNGDGQTAFDNATVLKDRVMLDNQLLITYITDTLGGVVGEGYEELTGQGRITIVGN